MFRHVGSTKRSIAGVIKFTLWGEFINTNLWYFRVICSFFGVRSLQSKQSMYGSFAHMKTYEIKPFTWINTNHTWMVWVMIPYMTPILRSRDGHFGIFFDAIDRQRSKANVAKIIISDPKVGIWFLWWYLSPLWCICIYVSTTPPQKKIQALIDLFCLLVEEYYSSSV